MIRASQGFLKVCSRANRKLVCSLLKTAAKPTANQRQYRDFCVEFQLRLKTALHKRAWNFFLTMEPAAPWLGQVKKQKAGCTSRQCTNVWVLHQLHPQSLLYIYGPKWSSPIIPDFQDNQRSVPREPQSRLGKTLTVWAWDRRGSDGTVSRRSPTVDPQ